MPSRTYADTPFPRCSTAWSLKRGAEVGRHVVPNAGLRAGLWDRSGCVPTPRAACRLRRLAGGGSEAGLFSS
eukprot:2010416-Rhodomonas_salina.1